MIDIVKGNKPEFMEGVSLLDLVEPKINRDEDYK